ncbi:[NiFe]-hydrogenase assembly chaperone HybE [Halomonas sp. WWR20]
MQSLSLRHYSRLRHLASCYTGQHAAEHKHGERRNPRLGVDALCFQWHFEELLGVLMTPLSLSLVLVEPLSSPADTDKAKAKAVEDRVVALPSGNYPMRGEWVVGDGALWRCELLDDLRELDGMLEASRLAQRLMQQVMTPTA